MNKTVKKYTFVFSILIIWTVPILMGIDKTEYGLIDTEALSYDEAFPASYYDEITMVRIDSGRMDELLLFYDFTMKRVIDSDVPEIQFFAVSINSTKRVVRKTACQVSKILEDNSHILVHFPELKRRYVDCSIRSTGGFVGVFVGGGVS